MHLKLIGPFPERLQVVKDLHCLNCEDGPAAGFTGINKTQKSFETREVSNIYNQGDIWLKFVVFNLHSQDFYT